MVTEIYCVIAGKYSGWERVNIEDSCASRRDICANVVNCLFAIHGNSTPVFESWALQLASGAWVGRSDLCSLTSESSSVPCIRLIIRATYRVPRLP